MSNKTIVEAQEVKTSLREMLERAKSCFEIIKILSTGKAKNLNLVRFVGYKAEDKNSAYARKSLQESGRGKGENVGHQILSKITGNSLNRNGNRCNCFLTMLSMTARKSNSDGYDYRTLIAGELAKQSRMDRLEVAEYFGKFFEIKLTDLPIFPVSNLKEALAGDLVSSQKLILVHNELVKVLNKIKKSLDKEETLKDKNGNVVRFIPSNPMTEKIIVTETGEDIPKETEEFVRLSFINSMVKEDFETNMVGLAEVYPNHTEYIEPVTQKNGKIKKVTDKWGFKADKKLLLFYMLESAKIKSGFEKAARSFLPYAFGEVERKMDGDKFPDKVRIGGITFQVKRYDDKKTTPKKNTAKMLENGTYTKKIVPSKRHGKWTIDLYKSS